MRSVIKISYFLILILSFSALAAQAADVAKIGVVDFQRILKESRAGKAVAKEMRQKQEERTRDLKKRREEIVKLQKYMENTEFVGDKEEREEKKLELNIKLDAFSDVDKKYNADLKEINNKYTAKIKNEVAGIIEKTGKKGGYLLILEKTDVLYSPVSNDITAKVIEQYNKEYKRKK